MTAPLPLLMPLLVPADGQMDRAGHNSGKSSLLSLLKVSPLCSFFCNAASKVRSNFFALTSTVWVVNVPTNFGFLIVLGGTQRSLAYFLLVFISVLYLLISFPSIKCKCQFLLTTNTNNVTNFLLV